MAQESPKADSVNAIQPEIQITDLSKESVYKIRPWVDIPLTLATDAWSLYG